MPRSSVSVSAEFFGEIVCSRDDACKYSTGYQLDHMGNAHERAAREPGGLHASSAGTFQQVSNFGSVNRSKNNAPVLQGFASMLMFHVGCNAHQHKFHLASGHIPTSKSRRKMVSMRSLGDQSRRGSRGHCALDLC